MIADDSGCTKAVVVEVVIDSTYILKLEPTVFVDGLDVGYEKRKESYGGSVHGRLYEQREN